MLLNTEIPDIDSRLITSKCLGNKNLLCFDTYINWYEASKIWPTLGKSPKVYRVGVKPQCKPRTTEVYCGSHNFLCWYFSDMSTYILNSVSLVLRLQHVNNCKPFTALRNHVYNFNEINLLCPPLEVKWLNYTKNPFSVGSVFSR